uniref:Uncharacterized protein n=1 Tax=Rousettus aegyptiacus TaxID=9407 RepID=A0A7J8DI00_ROUAE|nr:hypothetical protein HJG63_008609 [Rousettus aegyptiacus]
MNITEIQRIIQEYYERLHATKFDHLDETDKFLETYNLLRMNHEEMENLNRLILLRIKTGKEIITVIKSLPPNNSSGPEGFTGEFYKTFNIYLPQTLTKIEENEILPNSFYEANITLIPNQARTTQNKIMGQYI